MAAAPDLDPIKNGYKRMEDTEEKILLDWTKFITDPRRSFYGPEDQQVFKNLKELYSNLLLQAQNQGKQGKKEYFDGRDAEVEASPEGDKALVQQEKNFGRYDTTQILQFLRRVKAFRKAKRSTNS